MKHYNKIFIALRADLFQFLSRHHSEMFTLESGSLRMRDNHSMSIKVEYRGYHDFETEESGNNLDFLTKYLGYEESEAIEALCNDVSDEPIYPDTVEAPEPENLPPIFPEPTQLPYKALTAFLEKRAISIQTIKNLINAKLIYQDTRRNIVFINYARDFAEIRGTYEVADLRCKKRPWCTKYDCADNQWCAHMNTCAEYVKDPFHILAEHSKRDGFWCFQNGSNPTRCFVCEGSIDAISLYELHKKAGDLDDAYYAAIGGAGKQSAIDRIKRWTKVILAVDSDEAGNICRQRNSDLGAIIPKNKDWNEDLQAEENYEFPDISADIVKPKQRYPLIL